MGFEIEPKGQGLGALGCPGTAASCQAPIIGRLWRPLSPFPPLGPSQEDGERYTLRILTLVSLKGFLMDGLVLEGLSCRGRNDGCADLQSGGWTASGCLFPFAVCACSAAQSRLALCDPMDYSPPGSCVHGILQASRLEQVAISSSRGPSRPKDQNCLLCLLHWQMDSLPLYHCGPREAPVSSSAVVIMHRHENCSPVPG